MSKRQVAVFGNSARCTGHTIHENPDIWMERCAPGLPGKNSALPISQTCDRHREGWNRTAVPCAPQQVRDATSVQVQQEACSLRRGPRSRRRYRLLLLSDRIDWRLQAKVSFDHLRRVEALIIAQPSG